MTGAAYEQVEIAVVGNRRALVDMAVRLGNVAVTRGRNGGWNITYLPIGACTPWNFPTAEAAEAAMRRCDEVVEWDGFVAALARDERPNSIDLVVAILDAAGGVRQKRRTMSPRQLAKRLAEASS